MPIKKSAKKALRQNVRRKARNLIYKNKIKDLARKFRDFISEKKINEAQDLLKKIYKILDKAAKTGVIKKNTVSRKKSRLSKLLRRVIKK